MIFFCLALFLSEIPAVYSQEENAEYIEKIENKLTVSIRYIHRYSRLRITSRLNKDAAPVIYAPNVGGGIGASVKYKWLTLGYTFKLPRDEKYGNTKYTDITLDIRGRHFGLSFFYLQYRSLYIRNPDEVGYLPAGEVPLRPDLKVTTLGFLSNYAIRKNFSVKAAFDQTERQKKSAGSFLLMMGDRFSGLKNDSSFIPLTLKEHFDKTNIISDIHTNTLTVAPGGGYTFVLSRYVSITSILYLGWGVQMRFYDQDNAKKFNVRMPFFLKSMSAIGYNGEKFFCRLVYDLERNDIRFTDSNFAFFSSYLQFTLGVRILQ